MLSRICIFGRNYTVWQAGRFSSQTGILVQMWLDSMWLDYFLKANHSEAMDLFIFFVVPVFTDSRSLALSVSGCLCLDVSRRSTTLCYAHRSFWSREVQKKAVLSRCIWDTGYCSGDLCGGGPYWIRNSGVVSTLGWPEKMWYNFV